jgi:hypothetical protein
MLKPQPGNLPEDSAGLSGSEITDICLAIDRLCIELVHILHRLAVMAWQNECALVKRAIGKLEAVAKSSSFAP